MMDILDTIIIELEELIPNKSQIHKLANDAKFQKQYRLIHQKYKDKDKIKLALLVFING